MLHHAPTGLSLVKRSLDLQERGRTESELRVGDLVANALVRALAVVVLDLLAEGTAQRPLAEEDRAGQALSPDRTYEARAPRRRAGTAGFPAHGHPAYDSCGNHCRHCSTDLLVPFSCTGCAFRPPCGGGSMAKLAANPGDCTLRFVPASVNALVAVGTASAALGDTGS